MTYQIDEFEALDQSDLEPSADCTECEAQDEAVAEASAQERRLRQELERALQREKQLTKEFANYRRHAEDTLARAEKEVRVELLGELGDVVRLLELATDAVDQSPDSVREGIELVARSIEKVLHEHGLERIPTRGVAFDPVVHEAVFTENEPAFARGTVVQELAPGFRTAERVVRPAKVSVAS